MPVSLLSRRLLTLQRKPGCSGAKRGPFVSAINILQRDVHQVVGG